MTLRLRLTWVAATAVAVAVLLAALVCYLVVRDQLHGQIDSALHQQAGLVQQDPQACQNNIPAPPASSGGGAPLWQLVLSTGQIGCHHGNLQLPVDTGVLRVANGGGAYLRDVTVGGVDLRELVLPVQVRVGFDNFELGALQLARPLASANHILTRLRFILLLLALGGIALAAALGRLAARRVLAPLADVARTAQHVSETEDLSSRIRVAHPEDEVGQLATRFNAMIERLQHSRAAVDEAMRAQRQLVADASHELRTPVTSLRTNIEVLLAGDTLAPEDRRRLLSDVVEQTEELSALVGDLIELARGDLPLAEADDVRLDRVVEETLASARRNAPGIHFEATLHPVVMRGVPERLARAVSNLLDNAARHSPAGGTVEVRVDPGGVTVRDHGGGVEEADLPFIFDRFFRGTNSRARQGSGLGLAIVRQVAEQHGGSATAMNAPGGGALFTLRLPTSEPDAFEEDGFSPAESRAPVPGELR